MQLKKGDRVELIKDYIGENDMIYIDKGYKGTVSYVSGNELSVIVDADPGDTELDTIEFSHGMEIEYLKFLKENVYKRVYDKDGKKVKKTKED